MCQGRETAPRRVGGVTIPTKEGFWLRLWVRFTQENSAIIATVKAPWELYDYLRRYWWLLLLGVSIGAAGGIGIHIQRDHPTVYDLIATIRLSNVDSTTFEIHKRGFHAEEEAIKDITRSIDKLRAVTSTDIGVGSIVVKQIGKSSPAWKATTLGVIIGGLLSIGLIYLWNDARSYLHHLREREPEG